MQEHATEPETSDAQLWQQAVQGDHDAFAHIVERYGPQMVAFVRARIRRHEDAEDVTQDLWLRVLRSGSTFDGGNLRAWLYRISGNLLIDRGRKQTRNKSTEWNEGVVPVAPEDHEDERLDYLRECLDQLPSDFAGTLRLHLDGVPYDEIGPQQSISTGTVGSRISRAKRLLRDCVEGKMK